MGNSGDRVFTRGGVHERSSGDEEFRIWGVQETGIYEKRESSVDGKFGGGEFTR